ncbi:hypothetical protein [Sphingomonas alpina]|uniref:Uncharacterized protein n=1 Tax=Sphingomonas alpina TaxID=653931 RepID=A0A7H0LIZ8_9SPHN|nr:hypothetical protein [Sphingomonas alpina]QNQ09651.1 hypothetical protein H3Z74_24025 [Sphingomonas alpina]
MDPACFAPLTERQAAGESGMEVNHQYVDVRGCSIEDARQALTEEAEFLEELEASGWDGGVADQLMDDAYESEFLFGFDVGTAGAIFALSAAGAVPITSCNGGVIDGERHASDVPTILFSATPEILPPILRAAAAADAGLINNDGNVELFADWLPKLHAFAGQLLAELER